MIDPDRLLDILDSTDLLKRGDSRLPSDLNSTSRPDKILLENGLVDEKAMKDINEKKYFIGSEVIEDSDFEVKYVITMNDPFNSHLVNCHFFHFKFLVM